MRTLPRYALAGIIVMCTSEVMMLLEVEPFWTWHTAIAWTGWVLFADGFVWMRRGRSWLTDAPKEFAFLAIVSVPLWLVFEFYNLFIRNWHYIRLPENVVLRMLGFGWSFATIWPAILITAEAVGCLRTPQPVGAAHGIGDSGFGARTFRHTPPNPESPPSRSALRRGSPKFAGTNSSTANEGGRIPNPGSRDIALITLGLALLIGPLIAPSQFLAAPVWIGFILLLDPLNARLGQESLLGELRSGSRDRVINLLLSGLACGVLWEFWNYWARAKWIYTVPILEDVRIFEMPIAGYLGFPPFALECFTMYIFVRYLVWKGPKRPVAL
ncbi:MAG: hypothetical protein HY654_10980 [Acidobacteria bacterium]|nr:hypothetical protein [Acidobacteriota bacterium]